MQPAAVPAVPGGSSREMHDNVLLNTVPSRVAICIVRLCCACLGTAAKLLRSLRDQERSGGQYSYRLHPWALPLTQRLHKKFRGRRDFDVDSITGGFALQQACWPTLTSMITGRHGGACSAQR